MHFSPRNLAATFLRPTVRRRISIFRAGFGATPIPGREGWLLGCHPPPLTLLPPPPLEHARGVELDCVRAKSDGWRRPTPEKGGRENEKRDRAQWEVKLILIPHGSGALPHSLPFPFALSPLPFSSLLVSSPATLPTRFACPGQTAKKSAIAPTPSRPHIAKVRPVLPGSSFFPNSTDRFSSSYKNISLSCSSVCRISVLISIRPRRRGARLRSSHLCAKGRGGARQAKGDQRRIPLLHLPPRSLRGLAGLFP